MSFEHPGVGALDYSLCRYGVSRLHFRGPLKDLEVPYCAFIGGNETYGRFIEKPFPELVEAATGTACVNLGCLNAGVDVFLNDSGAMSVADGASVTVVQVLGAQNMSNRFYSVHPRRNDRFVAASALMRAVFRDVDFTDFSFNRHMLQSLAKRGPDRFRLVVDELKAAWLARMKLLLGRIQNKVVLLYMADHPPEETASEVGGALRDPLFVDRAMIDALRPHAAETLEVVWAREDGASLEGKVFSELEAPAAAETPGGAVHRAAAVALEPVLARMVAM
ncbi:hypothetical protein CLV78_11735 [Aliiruegeria haliotis]|uniref:DUF6473 domain-containing protein n=1 Tax=Aliiruegeria haliotis TaxID=1280846 RepID=A0A2T0RFH5_9RHOB|nr:DUF6473 family protein [Aliiruegeria haliotis]PRY19871.1 hypothetical protein CLV78_11735 [Aliiruegeria haliotis]